MCINEVERGALQGSHSFSILSQSPAQSDLGHSSSDTCLIHQTSNRPLRNRLPECNRRVSLLKFNSSQVVLQTGTAATRGDPQPPKQGDFEDKDDRIGWGVWVRSWLAAECRDLGTFQGSLVPFVRRKVVATFQVGCPLESGPFVSPSFLSVFPWGRGGMVYTIYQVLT